MKTIFVGLVILAVAAGFCIAAGTQEGTAGTAAPHDITIIAPVGGQSEEVMKGIAADFMKTEPNVTVKIIGTPWEKWMEVTLTAIAGGTPPDVLYLDSSNVYSFAGRGVLEPLESFTSGDATLEADDFFSTTVEMGKFEGTQYALPLTAAIAGLYYNVDLLEEAGLNPPTTWAELVERAKILTVPSKKQYGTYISGLRPMIAPYEKALAFIVQWVMPNGGEVMNEDYTKVIIDSREAIEALQYNIDLFYKHEIAPIPGGGLEREIWGSGHVAMWTEYLWLISWTRGNAPDLNFAVTFLPAGRAGHRSIVDCHFLSIEKDSKHKDSAYRFLRYLTSREAGWAVKNQRLPVRQSMSTLPFYLEDPAWSGFVKQMEYCTETHPKSLGLREIYAAIGEEIDNAYFQKKSPEQALKDAAVKANKIIERGVN